MEKWQKAAAPYWGNRTGPPRGGLPSSPTTEYLDFFADSLCPYSSAWLNLNLLSVGRSNWSNSWPALKKLLFNAQFKSLWWRGRTSHLAIWVGVPCENCYLAAKIHLYKAVMQSNMHYCVIIINMFMKWILSSIHNSLEPSGALNIPRAPAPNKANKKVKFFQFAR